MNMQPECRRVDRHALPCQGPGNNLDAASRQDACGGEVIEQQPVERRPYSSTIRSVTSRREVVRDCSTSPRAWTLTELPKLAFAMACSKAI